MPASRRAPLVFAALALISAGLVRAQTEIGATAPVESNHYPPALPKREDLPPPPLAFRVVASVALTSKLTGDAPFWEDGQLRVPVASGVATVDLTGAEPGVKVATDAAPPAHDEHRYVVSPDGERRFATLPNGTVVAEHRRGSGWRSEWERTLPAPAVAEPLLANDRLFVGSLDAQVYSLKPENGHLLWAVDVGDRVARPVVMWNGVLPGSMMTGGLPVSALLVSGQDGGTLLGLDPYDGRTLATFELKLTEGRFASGIAALPDGRIAIGRETYATPEGDVLVLALERAPERDSPPAAPHAR